MVTQAHPRYAAVSPQKPTPGRGGDPDDCFPLRVRERKRDRSKEAGEGRQMGRGEKKRRKMGREGEREEEEKKKKLSEKMHSVQNLKVTLSTRLAGETWRGLGQRKSD